MFGNRFCSTGLRRAGRSERVDRQSVIGQNPPLERAVERAEKQPFSRGDLGAVGSIQTAGMRAALSWRLKLLARSPR